MIRTLAIAFVCCFAASAADAGAEVFAVAESMASALAADNATSFMNVISKEMTGRDQLAINVRAMLAQAEAVSAVTIVEDQGDDSKRTLVLDWSLRLRRKGDDLRAEERREAVTLTFVREGKKWRVTALNPMALFAPPDFR